MAIAIAVTMTMTAVLSAVPAAAVSADCTDDFLIPDNEPAVPRSLAGDASEVGKEDVTASGGDEKVTIRLESLDDKLEFGVFVLDSNNGCVSATSLDQSDCGASETLSTVNQAPSVETTCRIDAPSSGSVDYFFHVENQQSDALDYSIWMSK